MASLSNVVAQSGRNVPSYRLCPNIKVAGRRSSSDWEESSTTLTYC